MSAYSGKTAVVTGASSGIGRARAEALARAGFTVFVTNAAPPSMRHQRNGRIINIGSVSGRIPAPYSAHHAATKHALEGYSDSLDHHEIRAFNIRVSGIEPAYTRTVFDQNSLEPDKLLGEYDQARAGVRPLVQDVMPASDLPEVAAAVVLAETASRPRRRHRTGKRARHISMLRRLVPSTCACASRCARPSEPTFSF